MGRIRTSRWAVVAALVSASTLGATLAVASPGHRAHSADASATAPPIQHLVVIFQENAAFAHYFGPYPNAANTSGQPFDARHQDVSVNGLANTPGLGGTG